VDAMEEDVMHPDSKQKSREAILARLRELYEPVVAPAAPAPATAKAPA
jgi:hypothetical protein